MFYSNLDTKKMSKKFKFRSILLKGQSTDLQTKSLFLRVSRGVSSSLIDTEKNQQLDKMGPETVPLMQRAFKFSKPKHGKREILDNIHCACTVYKHINCPCTVYQHMNCPCSVYQHMNCTCTVYKHTLFNVEDIVIWFNYFQR